jgi:hypothetical protein
MQLQASPLKSIQHAQASLKTIIRLVPRERGVRPWKERRKPKLASEVQKRDLGEGVWLGARATVTEVGAITAGAGASAPNVRMPWDLNSRSGAPERSLGRHRAYRAHPSGEQRFRAADKYRNFTARRLYLCSHCTKIPPLLGMYTLTKHLCVFPSTSQVCGHPYPARPRPDLARLRHE